MKKIVLSTLLVFALVSGANAGMPFNTFAAGDTMTYVYSAVTLEMSAVNGAAFITQVSGSIPFSSYLNRKITISDGSNSISGFIKSVGTGETYGAEIVSSWTNFGAGSEYGTFTTAGANITSAIHDGVGYAYSKSNDCELTIGALYKDVATLTLNSGETPWHAVGSNSGNTGDMSDNLSAGANTRIFTFNTTDYDFLLVRSNNAADFSCTFSLKQITAPDSSGCTIVSARGGATYNWTSNGGINPNAANYTVTIEQ